MLIVLALSAVTAFPWSHEAEVSVRERFAPPSGARRVALPAGHLGRFLRALPVRPGRGDVRLYDGRLKPRQDVHVAVLDVDIGARDLQQCADLAYRLHAEWQRATGGELCYRFTSGHQTRWTDWKAGLRPQVHGSKVDWSPRRPPGSGYPNFRSWLDNVFTYAGSASLHRDTQTPRTPVLPGDLYVQPGFPGHVVVVLDVVKSPGGRRWMLLAQSYMPAQSPHVLRGPVEGAWYPATDGPLSTPEWRFSAGARRRFPKRWCR